MFIQQSALESKIVVIEVNHRRRSHSEFGGRSLTFLTEDNSLSFRQVCITRVAKAVK